MRHSISNRHTSSSKAALLTMLTLLGMGGCSNGALLSLHGLNDEPVVTSSVAPSKPEPLQLRPKVEPVNDIVLVNNNSVEKRARASSWCEQMRESTAAETTIMRSPNLSGSMADDGKASLNLSLSYSDFKRASLMEQAAEARCRKYLAETGLNVLVFVSPQNLTATGFRAKADTILGQVLAIRSLRTEIAKAMASGAIDREKATGLSVLLDQLVAEGNAAKSQADRRINARLLDGKSSETLSRELLQAEGDLDHINSEMATANSMDVKAELGWNDDVNNNGFNMNDQSFSGKVSFSMKLGALNPKRFEHEQRATEAKLRAITTEEGGAVWQVGILKQAHERAISGLAESQVHIDQALKETKHLLSILESEKVPDFEGARLSARFEIIKLKADRAGVVGSLAEIKTNLKRLKNG
jgi:hypothetical protein